MSFSNFVIQEFTFENIISLTTISFAAPHIYKIATHAENTCVPGCVKCLVQYVTQLALNM